MNGTPSTIACSRKYSSTSWPSYLTNNQQTHGGAIFTSGGIIPSKVPDNLSSYNIVDLPENLKKVFYKYDCDMVPFFENQLGVVEACDSLADLWGLARSPESPSQPTPCTKPVIDPSPSVSSFESSPSLFSKLWEKQISEVQVLFWTTSPGQTLRHQWKTSNQKGENQHQNLTPLQLH